MNISYHKIAVVFLVFSVIVLASCKAPFFNTANNMRLINGTVYTKDGREIPGQVTVNLEQFRASRTQVTVLTRDSKQPQVFPITEVKGINIRSDYYEPKLIDMGGLGNNDEFRFVKRMTKEGSKIQMYELFQQVTRQANNRFNGGGNSYQTPEYSYYIVTPAHTRQMPAWNIEGRRLSPNFEDKMSEIVKSCPSLAEKIKTKEKGYFYAQVSFNGTKRIETMLGIIDEFNKCQ